MTEGWETGRHCGRRDCCLEKQFVCVVEVVEQLSFKSLESAIGFSQSGGMWVKLFV